MAQKDKIEMQPLPQTPGLELTDSTAEQVVRYVASRIDDLDEQADLKIRRIYTRESVDQGMSLLKERATLVASLPKLLDLAQAPKLPQDLELVIVGFAKQAKASLENRHPTAFGLATLLTDSSSRVNHLQLAINKYLDLPPET